LFRKSFCAEQSSVVIQNRLFDVLASLIARREPMPSSAVIDDLSRSPPISSIGTVWQLFTDRVMGGVSNGTMVRELVAGRPVIRMRGDVRLEHNGGFVQIALDLALAGKLVDASSWSGIELEILGNNEQYNIHLRTADLIRPWQSYRQSFLADGRWRTVRLLFRDFKPYRTDKLWTRPGCAELASWQSVVHFRRTFPSAGCDISHDAMELTQAAGQRICTRRVIQSKTGFVSIVAYGLGPTSKWRLSMSPLKTIAASAVAIALSLSAANAAEKPNIVQTAMSNGSFNTLVTAVKAAGLVDTLSGPGPFTVFAPTDDAFARLPNGTVEKLLKPENKKQLVAILTYHVVAGKVMSKDIAGKKTEAKSVEGEAISIDATKGAVKVDNAKVLKADVEASNGVIHVIDTVIMPKM
jgi:uncharacterized surface protein with fasciclin (FAS1) repeats